MSQTLRLVYPQWQGGIISHWIKELKPEDSSRGYYLGAKLLSILAPENNTHKTIEVPVSLNIEKREVKNGIMDYDYIVKQTNSALDILNKNNPDKIIVFGGECSVSAAPFTYLNKKYNNDIALIWIDAHPDITLPEDNTYAGYHAMAVSACMGKIDAINNLPSKISSENILFLGLRDWEREEIRIRQKEYGIKHFAPEEISKSSECIIKWLKECKASKVFIHFDLDVLDPNEIIAAVGVSPNGMKINEAVRVINDIAGEKELAGLTIAEHMPRVEILMKNMMAELPLFN
ncbi:arginase family protein [Brachyspira murdochii]|uniref:Arginase/agmatinase/formiminoglutamase n=1 Tax=Brachyspira murdochii (strain ATCC 51284 / DSM 12563 / 56-150) TaxID=526224 RepID=D5U9G3_BRAM5|nr:arginase family protein [Brachyspira murdochii]ADG71336.1 Arginase/agmatinase/formiminoglutamase [Brachyspira murdochii DSM 12563]